MSPCLDDTLWGGLPLIPLLAAVGVGLLCGVDVMWPLIWLVLGMWVMLVCHEYLWYRRSRQRKEPDGPSPRSP